MLSKVAGAVDRRIAPGDGMFAGNHDHYFSVGESALNVILSALEQSGGGTPKRVLDFGAGAGRVTRWLMAAFPAAEIHACDVRPEDMEFLRTSFGIKAETVGTDQDALTISGRYDLIWVGSVITHLDAVQTDRLVRKLFSQVLPDGLLVMSFHGKCAIDRQDSGTLRYIDDAAWQVIKAGYFATGYGYADYPGQQGYGISVTNPSWMSQFLAHIPASRIVLMADRVWDNHHDVFALQRLA